MILITLIIIGVFGTIGILFARGYRFDTEKLELLPKGLLVANSEPNGAQVYVDGKLETATNATISLSPGPHAVEIKKEGFLTWQKTIEVAKEEVTQVDAFLVSTAPNLSALTFSGAINPVSNKDLTSIAYAIAPNGDNGEKAGLWVIETVNLPLGFNRSSRQITNGDLTEATWEWSPNGSEILLTTSEGAFLLDASKYTPQNQLVNIITELNDISRAWEEENQKQIESRLEKLPDELAQIFEKSAKGILFSPDEDRILYTASGSASIPEGFIDPLPGASTQKEEREITDGNTYVYDTKEDKNFKVGTSNDIIHWLPNSVNLISPKENEIKVMDYDGTNNLTVFSGNYSFPHAYSSSSANRILILTNLGAQDSPTNLYWLGLR